jgi:hypothetical protein
VAYGNYDDECDELSEREYPPGPDCPKCGSDETILTNGAGRCECLDCDFSWQADDTWRGVVRDREYDDDLIDGVGFADPGGNSALRAATPTNPRNLPCPSCGRPNRLTPADRARGYQCDACADACERGAP